MRFSASAGPRASRGRRVSVLEELERRQLMATTPYISEFVANNSTGLQDSDGDRPDWIEVHNPTSDSVSLGGHYLTDDAADKRKWAFPSASVPANGRIVVFASDKNRRTAGQPLHTNFKLDAAGEYLALVKPDGSTVLSQFSPKYADQLENVSYGTASTGQVGYLATPTPGAANSGLLTQGVVADTRFSHHRGFYTSAFSVTITSSTSGAQIRYTLDGSAPTATTGAVYTGPVPISKTTVLRAAAFKTGYLPSNVDTQTYLFLNDVIRQPSTVAGWPTPGTQGMNDTYQMDPDVVNSSTYASRIIPALKAVPSISIALKPGDLFGSSGIYTNSMEDGEAWERAGSAEMILPNNTTAFQVEAGVRIQGGVGRNPAFPKHSFRLLFKDKYGDPKLEYPLFKGMPGGENAVDEFDTLTLRAGFNNTWLFNDESQRLRAQYLQDQFSAATQLAMGHPAIHGNFVHLYLNGLYWGLYNIVERPDADFAAGYLGGSKSQYDALNSGEPVDGDKNAWNAMHNIANGIVSGAPWTAANPNPDALASSSAYERIKQYLDVENFVDYMILNFYGGNHDWDDHNWYAARKRDSTGRFKFFSWDAERTLESPTANRTGVNQADKPSRLYRQLRANPEFRMLFADRVHKHFFNDGVLTPAKARERYAKLTAMIDSAVIAESARWGDYRTPDRPYTRDVEWVNEKNRILNSYMPVRTNNVLNQLKAIGLYPTVNAPSFSKHGGTIASGTALTINRPGSQTGTIYYTLDGTDPRLPGGGVRSGAKVYTGAFPLTASGTVKARILSGSTWSALNEARFTVSGSGGGGTGSISGFVYNDLDKDGTRDSGESGLSGWTVYLDLNASGTRDSSEPSVLSDASGNYRFSNLAAGTYRVRGMFPSGWTRIVPSTGYHSVTLTAGQAVTGIPFAFAQSTTGGTNTASISGTAFNDLDGDGVRDTGEAGLSGWTVYLDLNANSARDTGEPSVLTDSAGDYRFSNLAAGTYRVRGVFPSGWRRVVPSGGYHSVTLTSGQASTGKRFAFTQKILISGTVFNDLDGDAVRDSGESGLSAWRVFVDADTDGVFDSTEKSILSDSSGNWSFKDLAAGTYVIRVVTASGWARTVPTSGSYSITLANGRSSTGRLFGARQTA